MNQMLKVALWYAEMGWHIFPIVPGQKEPMTKNGVLDASCDPHQIEMWWRPNPDGNIGLACGEKSGVYVVDIDVDTEKGIDGFLALTDLTDKWPDTVCQLTPRGGKHFFFQTKDPPRNKNNFKEGIDIRGEGYYVLLAPSIHPNGKMYQWAAGREPLAMPLAPFPKYMRPEKVEIAPMAPLPKLDISADERLKRASAYLAQCAPAEQGRGGHDALFWAATCMVHGFELNDNEALSLLENEYNPRCTPPWNLRNPRDSKDFRRKVDEARRCPPGKPMGWLLHETRVGADPKFSKQIDKMLAEELESAFEPVSAGLPQIKEYTEEGEEKLPLSPEANEILDSVLNDPIVVVGALTGDEIESLDTTNIGKREKEIELHELKKRLCRGHSGMLKELIQWIDSTGFKLQPMLTLGCALTFLGALFGRKLRDEHGSRTNLYSMGIARSSAGKGHAMKCVRHLAHIAGAGDLIGGSSVGSDIAVINKLAEQKVVLYMWDEIGFLLAKVTSPHAGANKMLIPTLMSLFSAASDVYIGREYADITKQVKLVQPCCCLYGTSEISRFTDGLNPQELRDGFLARCMIFRADNESSLTMDNDCFEDTAPEGLVEMVGEWYSRVVGDPDNSEKWEVKNGVPLEPLPEQIVVPASNNANIVFQEFINWCETNAKGETKTASLWNKAHENARKIALILAGSDNFYEPKITEEMARYACDLIEYLINDFIGAFVDEITDSFNAKQSRQVYKVIHQYGIHGCTKSQLTTNTNFMRRYEREAVIADLLESEQIIVAALPLKPEKHPGRPVTNFYASEFYKEKLYADQSREGEYSDAAPKQDTTAEQSSSVDGGPNDESQSDEAVPTTGEGEN